MSAKVCAALCQKSLKITTCIDLQGLPIFQSTKQHVMKTSYDSDVIVWAQEQVNLLRSGQFSRLDIEHIAEGD